MGKEAIIDKILADSEVRANAMLGEATSKAEEILAGVFLQCETFVEKSKMEILGIERDIAKRSETVAELDAKKLVQKAKSEILNRTFALALDKTRNLDKETYSKLILGMLKQAEDGDTVIVSKREKGIVTAAVIAEESKKRGIKLALSNQLGDFDGGIVLSQAGIDKNLSLELEFFSLRDAVEADIAKELLN